MDRAKTRETLLVLTGALVVFYLIFPIVWLLYIAVLLAALGAFFPKHAVWIALGWMKLSGAIGFVVSRILLTLIFFGILWPVAMLYRLFSKDPLQLKKTSENSYYCERNHAYTPADFEKPW